MRVVIAGAGEVGFHIARLLAAEAQDTVLIDLDATKLRYAESHIDVYTLRGDSTSFRVLKEARVEKCDLLIAVTNSQAINLTTAIIGKKLGAKKTIARIKNTEFLFDRDTLDMKSLGIDELICPESLAAREIKRLVKDASLTDNFEFEDGALKLVGTVLTEDSPIAGKTLSEAAVLSEGTEMVTTAIQRRNETIIPRGDTRFKVHDHVLFITLKDAVEKVCELAGRKRVEVKNVLILGGGDAGQHAARKLGREYRVKVIEQDREKCLRLVERLAHAMIIHGDGTNVELLKEEGIRNTQVFIAVTGNSETNIISCLVARNYGVEKTIALVENMDYIPLSQRIGIDTMINKKLIAANFIFRYIREGDIVSLTGIHGMDAEVLEFKVHEKSKVTKRKIKDLGFPKVAIIAGVVRRGEGMIAMGEFQIEAEDKVVVFSLPEAIRKVEQFFK